MYLSIILNISILNIMDKYIIGMVSGMTATICVQPFDLIKVNIQLNPTQSKYTTINNIFNNGPNKLGNFYKGINVALLRQSIYGTIRLGMFQDLKDNYKVNPLIAATVGASIATIVNNPIDYWLVNRQTYRNFNIATHIKQNGFKQVITTGLSYNLLRAISINTGFGLKPYIEQLYKRYIFDSKLISKSSSIVTSCVLSTIIAIPFDVMRTLSQKNIPFTLKELTITKIYASYPAFAMRVVPHSIIAMSCLEVYTELYKKINL